MVAESLAAAGGSVVILTSTITSPTTKQVIAEFLAKYPGSRHFMKLTLSYSGMLLAIEVSYGKAIPSYHFENAKVIVSLGADLGTWLSLLNFNMATLPAERSPRRTPAWL